jgi:7-cyano-7-deazaguanine tRNA-ribosyltransferase
MASFEVLKRDGMARICRFETSSGFIETPALLPVVNPKINTVSPRELHDKFGFGALITNSYIIKNTPELKERAQAEGLHKMLDFNGLIMTDSGTFQSHMYGEVDLTNPEIIEFQKSIGTDIGTVLDIFTEPEWSKEKTRWATEETLKRTNEACAMKGNMLLNGVIQGSVYTDLRTYCAEKMADMDIDVHPIGGVVPLMEQYRYSDLVDVVMSSKMGLNPARPVHLFGAGHPMVLAFAALMGCDLFDSASYAKFARDDRLMFVDGTFRLQEMQSLDCDCPACRGITLEALKNMKNGDRESLIARHNLHQIKEELEIVKRYIREGRLWELAEMRCRAHPAMLDGLRRLAEYRRFMEAYDPISREGALFYTGPETYNRPVFQRYESRLMTRYVPPSNRVMLFPDNGGKPYSRSYANEFDIARRNGYTPVVVTPFGPVPAELDELYPLSQSLFPSITDSDTERRSMGLTMEFLQRYDFEETVKLENVEDTGSSEYDADMLRALAVSRYQFGIIATEALFRGKVELVKSKNTNKIRNVISDGEHILSMRAGDGMYTLKTGGAARIAAAVPSPYMRVVVDDDSVPYVIQGRNAFCQFVIDCDPGLRPMEEVIVTDRNDRVLATGRAMMTRKEIESFRRGVAVKVRSGTSDEP